VKFDRSRKFKVEMGKDEKKGWVGSVVGVGRLAACRVMRERRRTGETILMRGFGCSKRIP
jgi:hypothetical protein